MVNSRRSTTKNQWVYHDRRWRIVRLAALKRDNWTCVNCRCNVRARGTSRVDHIKLVEKRPDLAFALDNLRTLCVKCDAARHWLDRGGSGFREAGRQALRNADNRDGLSRLNGVGINLETGEKHEIGEDGWPK